MGFDSYFDGKKKQKYKWVEPDWNGPGLKGHPVLTLYKFDLALARSILFEPNSTLIQLIAHVYLVGIHFQIRK